jgi:hypothetical protein
MWCAFRLCVRVVVVDQHQRQMWEKILKVVDDFRGGTTELGKLVQDLRGLYVEADPHDPEVRFGFEAVWSPIDGEHMLRTEAWAPVGSSTEESLASVVKDFRSFVGEILAADTGPEHG